MNVNDPDYDEYDDYYEEDRDEWVPRDFMGAEVHFNENGEPTFG